MYKRLFGWGWEKVNRVSSDDNLSIFPVVLTAAVKSVLNSKTAAKHVQAVAWANEDEVKKPVRLANNTLRYENSV